MITGILKELGFKSTILKRNLYHGKLDGQAVLICRMVDDYAIACHNPAIAERIIARINEKATIDRLGVGAPASMALITFNRVTILKYIVRPTLIACFRHMAGATLLRMKVIVMTSPPLPLVLLNLFRVCLLVQLKELLNALREPKRESGTEKAIAKIHLESFYL
jgi:hypothetical protein